VSAQLGHPGAEKGGAAVENLLGLI
jgi:hypothetical protein